MHEMNNELSPAKRLIRLLSVDRADIINIYICAGLNGLISLTIPLGVQAVIGLIMAGSVSASWLLLVGLVVLGVLATGALLIMQVTLTEILQQRLFMRSAVEFTYRIPRVRPEALGGTYAPELMNRFFDTTMVQKGLPKVLIDLPSAVLQIVFGLLLLSFYHPYFIVFGLLLLLMLAAIFRFTWAAGLRSSLVESKYKYRVVHWLEELARSLYTFKLSGDSVLPMQRADALLKGYLSARRSHFRVLLVQLVSTVLFKTLITATLLVLGGLLVMDGALSIGQFVASEIVIILVLNAVEKLIGAMESVYDTLTAIEKVGNVSDLPLERVGGRQLVPASERGMEVTLQGVSHGFSEGPTDVLSDISIHIPSGSRLAVCGDTGSGKSVLMRLLGGVLEPVGGKVLFDGQSIGSLALDSLRQQVSVCTQEDLVFNGTVEENVSLGRIGIGTDQVMAALNKVGLGEWLTTLPSGLDTVLDPEGRRLPRSISQRLIVARCIVHSPRFLVMEDVLASVPTPVRRQVFDVILAPDAPWTLVLSSPDRTLTARFDRTIWLKDGRVVTESPDTIS